MIGATVVGKPAATVMTSSPLLILLSLRRGLVSAMKAPRLAEEPELTREQNLTPKYSANFFSNSSVYLPDVSQNSRDESTRFTISSLPYTLLAYGILSPSSYAFTAWNFSAYSLTSARIFPRASFSLMFSNIIRSSFRYNH